MIGPKFVDSSPSRDNLKFSESKTQDSVKRSPRSLLHSPEKSSILKLNSSLSSGKHCLSKDRLVDNKLPYMVTPKPRLNLGPLHLRPTAPHRLDGLVSYGTENNFHTGVNESSNERILFGGRGLKNFKNLKKRAELVYGPQVYRSKGKTDGFQHWARPEKENSCQKPLTPENALNCTFATEPSMMQDSLTDYLRSLRHTRQEWLKNDDVMQQPEEFRRESLGRMVVQKKIEIARSVRSQSSEHDFRIRQNSMEKVETNNRLRRYTKLQHNIGKLKTEQIMYKKLERNNKRLQDYIVSQETNILEKERTIDILESELNPLLVDLNNSRNLYEYSQTLGDSDGEDQPVGKSSNGKKTCAMSRVEENELELEESYCSGLSVLQENGLITGPKLKDFHRQCKASKLSMLKDN